MYIPVFLFLFIGCHSLAKTSIQKPVSMTKSNEKNLISQISEKKWLLAGYNTGRIFVPLEPEHGSTGWILFQKDGKFEGNTGVNSFSGIWTVKKNTRKNEYNTILTIKKLTKQTGPNEIAKKFDQDIIHQIEASKRLKTGRDSFLFLNEQEETLLQFIYQESNVVF